MTCLADCLVDNSMGIREIRPIANPRKLVWLYFNVEGRSSGTLESRQFNPCQCGCGNLIANPPANKDTGPTFIPEVIPDPLPLLKPIKLSWFDKLRGRLCQWLCHR